MTGKMQTQKNEKHYKYMVKVGMLVQDSFVMESCKRWQDISSRNFCPLLFSSQNFSPWNILSLNISSPKFLSPIFFKGFN